MVVALDARVGVTGEARDDLAIGNDGGDGPAVVAAMVQRWWQ